MISIEDTLKQSRKVEELLSWLDEQPFSDGCIALHVEDIKLLPTTPAVYMICEEEALYIGQTRNLFMRFRNGHHALNCILTDGKIDNNKIAITWDDFTGDSKASRLAWERRMISKYSPAYNKDNHTVSMQKWRSRLAKGRVI